ncbi:MAG: UbiD family decarboxylase, partial [Candidatus Dadabacteria bacterium]
MERFLNLKEYLEFLKKEGELAVISEEVNPYLEIAEIQRRVIAQKGPALLFTKVAGSPYPLAVNLFGTEKRINIAFGDKCLRIIQQIAALLKDPPLSFKAHLKKGFSLLPRLISLGSKVKSRGKIVLNSEEPSFSTYPITTSWPEDGGPFITLGLVHTEHPLTGAPNLGIYRMQVFNNSETGMHFQLGKGGGYHLFFAKEHGTVLPTNVIIGGPPALFFFSIAPLPENVFEFLLASFLLGKKLKFVHNPFGSLPLFEEAEFVLSGYTDPFTLRKEGPFGDHYGCYSLVHKYPVFKCKRVFKAESPIWTATVVGKPPQEDFYLGNYIQELFSPIFPLIMPSVKDIWAFGETGFHPLAAVQIKERTYKEALTTAFRVLGEGQLALTKVLLVVDIKEDLRNFKAVLRHILERADFREDLYIISNLALDTLDYTGPSLHKGSKMILVGCGKKVRKLPQRVSPFLQEKYLCKPFVSGCLVVEGKPYSKDKEFCKKIAKDPLLLDWPLIFVVDNLEKSLKTSMSFMWSVFTRFEPASDIYASLVSVHRNRLCFKEPIV